MTKQYESCVTELKNRNALEDFSIILNVFGSYIETPFIHAIKFKNSNEKMRDLAISERGQYSWFMSKNGVIIDEAEESLIDLEKYTQDDPLLRFFLETKTRLKIAEIMLEFDLVDKNKMWVKNHPIYTSGKPVEIKPGSLDGNLTLVDNYRPDPSTYKYNKEKNLPLYHFGRLLVYGKNEDLWGPTPLLRPIQLLTDKGELICNIDNPQ